MNEHENALCPCESGKRCVDCCLVLHLERSRGNPARAANEEVQRLVSGRNFDSLDDLNAFICAYWDRRNSEPRPDFLGLSSHQVHRLIDFPLEMTSDMVRLNGSFGVEDMAGIPVVGNAVGFLRALAPVEPLKATATGNLPREFAKRLFEDIDQSRWKKYVNFRREPDSMTVHTLRLILAMGGWIKKEKGHFRLSRKGRKIAETGFTAVDYLDLFATFTRKFNWGYQDRYPELLIIQRSFLFSLFILHKKARSFVEDYSLSPYFVRAFPLALAEADRPWENVFGAVNHCFSFRFLEGFCAYFGLVEVEERDDDPFRRPLILKTSGFFDKLLIWKA